MSSKPCILCERTDLETRIDSGYDPETDEYVKASVCQTCLGDDEVWESLGPRPTFYVVR